MPRPAVGLLGAFLAVILVASAVPFLTDWLWFQEVGYAQVFLSILSMRGSLVVGVGVAVFLVLYANLTFAARTAPPDVLWELEDQLGLPSRVMIEPLIRRALVPFLLFVALISGLRAGVSWETFLGYRNQVPFGATDPLFGRDLAFFVFTLPFWELLHGWAFSLVLGTLVLALILYVLQRSIVLTNRGPRLAQSARTHLLIIGAVLLVLKAIGFWLDRFALVFSGRGIVFGATYTDTYASLPILGGLAVLALLCAAACLAQITQAGLRIASGALLALGVVWLLGLGVYPSLLQRFRVTPNELVAERPFIEHNIRMTRQAYGLDRIVEQDFPVDDNLDAKALERNAATITNIRLWDHRPLLRTYGQFVDVDNDRYLVDGQYRQLMLSPRELSYQHLPSRIWINEHLTYTHGYGVVVGPVSRISAEGLPEFYVKDIPPRSTPSFVPITRPEIYYGEISNTYVFVGTRSQELDYPAGDQNVYASYAGRGGIPISSWFRKLAFALRFGELKILLSNDVTAQSRIMIYRRVEERVQQITPFFTFDRDPYIVVTDDGRLVWIIDGYTTTHRYPYSDPVRGVGNYIRNSVKVTVDAYHGTVQYYTADDTDPIVQVYARAFPGLLKPLAEMPDDLRRHLRYPEDFFSIQARKYATYHMQDPQVFYNKEDLWAIPRRVVDGREIEMEPYFTIMRLLGERREEFILLSPFNPSRRDNMIAWLAARSDPPNYGRLLVYNFPKQKLVYGPRQVDARIDQDPVISQQLALWNQRGSTVIRGSLLAIPIERALLYVQPLYLAAAEQGALPELRRVIVAYGSAIAMEPTLEQSLARIFGGRPPGLTETRSPLAADRPSEPAAPVGDLVRRAWDAWNRSQEALRRGDWAAYGAEQKALEDTLRALRR